MPNDREYVSPIWKKDYQFHIQKLTFSRLRIASLLIVIVVVLDGSAQLLLKPELFGELFWVRLIASLMIIVILGLTYIQPVSRVAFALSLIATLIVAADIEAAIIVTGGYHSPFQTGLALLIIAVGLLIPYSVTQMAIASVLVWIVYLMPVMIGEQVIDSGSSGFYTNSFFLICSSVIAVTASHVTSHLRREEFFSQQALKEEQAKSEYLLLNILPEPIANRLKDQREPIADSFDEVTVLFADIVGFTPFSERLPPADIVAFLNEIFSCFDDLTERHGLEKIKTIGDAYMVAGGLPSQKEDHAEAVAAMALDMIQELNRFNKRTGETLDIRIGINTGPVVAGVIGKKKFIYDLWGDTVNTASRMESHGVAGNIHVTESTYSRLSENYEFQERGVIQVKGKGEMRTYFLKAHKRGRDVI